MEFYEAKTAEELENLNKLYGHFEDAMIVQMGYTGGDYADNSGYGHLMQTNDLRVTFQRLDDHPFSIVLWFTHTR